MNDPHQENRPQEIKKNQPTDGHDYFLESEGELSEPEKLRLEKIKKLKSEGSDLYQAGFQTNSSVSKIVSDYSSLKEEERVEGNFLLAGRILSVRKHGKALFADLLDAGEKIQLYLNKKSIGDDKFDSFLDYDIGDWIGLEGSVFVTRRGQLTIDVKDHRLLSKSLRTMPEKWHGLKDKELKYRQRYLDFIVDPGLREVFLTRTKVIHSLKSFLDSKGFIEVETPMLQAIPGGAAARPFITHHNALDIDLYLRIAPELYLKRLIIAGFKKVYEINRNFRNEGISYKHNPEFTMLEFYQAFTDYNGLMDLTEEMLKEVSIKATGSAIVKYKDQEIHFDGKWQKFTMLEAIDEFTGHKVDFDTDTEKLLSIAEDLEVDVDKHFSKGKIINEIFEQTVESKLIQPTFIKDYPVDISPLARRHPENLNLTERFELFIAGQEIANAFSELIDPKDQYQRFKEQVKSEDEEERVTGKIDTDFLKALEYGMPPTGGEGIGIDRLVMILTGKHSIKDVILFPLLKPEF